MYPDTLSIRAKLFLSFGLVFLLVAAIGGSALLHLHAVNEVAREMRNDRLPNIQLLSKLQVLVLRTRTNGARLITAETPDLRAEVSTTLMRRDAEMSVVQAAFDARPKSQDAKILTASFKKNWSTYKAMQDAVIAQVTAGEAAAAQRIYNTDMSAGVNAVLTPLQKLIELEEQEASASAAHAQATYDTALVQSRGVVGRI